MIYIIIHNHCNNNSITTIVNNTQYTHVQLFSCCIVHSRNRNSWTAGVIWPVNNKLELVRLHHIANIAGVQRILLTHSILTAQQFFPGFYYIFPFSFSIFKT